MKHLVNTNNISTDIDRLIRKKLIIHRLVSVPLTTESSQKRISIIHYLTEANVGRLNIDGIIQWKLNRTVLERITSHPKDGSNRIRKMSTVAVTLKTS